MQVIFKGCFSKILETPTFAGLFQTIVWFTFNFFEKT